MDANAVGIQKRIMVVGAGIAGISAAKEIHKSCLNFDVKILEASHRVGGRILTISIDGEPVELGATFIHGTTTNIIYELSKRYGLVPETEQCAVNIDAVLSSGEVVSREAIMRCWDKWSLLLANDELENASTSCKASDYKDLYDYYAAAYLKLMKEDHTTMEVLNAPTYSNSIFECFLKYESVSEGVKDCKNANVYDDYVNLPGVPDVRFDKGCSYGNLLNKLVEDLPKDSILYGREVVSISTENDPILIKCRNGEHFEADHVIITVSLGVLKRRCLDENILPNECSLFTPALPVEKEEAIRRLGFGQIGKIVLQFDREIPSQHNSEILMMLWLAEDKSDPIIMRKFPWVTDLFMLQRIHDTYFYESWVVGSTVTEVEHSSKEEIREAFLYVLNKMLRFPLPNVLNVHMHSWGSDLLFGGCYTANLANVDTSACILALGKPLADNRVLFAGEATSVEYYSTVHGAYCTGVREAKRLKDIYQI